MVLGNFAPEELMVYALLGLIALGVMGFVLGYALTVSVGLANMTLRKLPAVGKAFMNYFGSPSTENLEVDWSLRQLFRLFNYRMSERWYEARVHTRQSVWISLLCAFNILTIVRFEFESKKEEGRHYYKVKTWKWTLSFKSDQEKMKFLLDEVKNVRPHMPIDAGDLYQIFVAGDNVVWDYMNGGLGKYRTPDDFFQVM